MMATVATLVAGPIRGQVHHPVAVQIHGAVSHRHRPTATIHGQNLHHVADLLREEVIARHHAVDALITTAGVAGAVVVAEIHGAGQGEGDYIPNGSLRMPTL